MGPEAETAASLDISSQAFWSRPSRDRAATFAELRRRAPVSFQEPSPFDLVPGRGYWAVTRHADVQHVSRTPELFCSGQGIGMADIPPEVLELNASFLVMDAPRHTKLRRIVSGAFTPRRVAQLEEAITAEASRIVDEFVDRGGGDVVELLSARLPLWTISTMLGVPEEARPELHRAAELQVAAQDPEFQPEGTDAMSVLIEASMTMHRIAAELVAEKRARPTDDVLSALVQAEVDGEALADQELGAIFVLFAVAGNDTTRNATSHGMKFFSDDPDQWARLAGEPALLGSAVEEIVRCASPVIHFRRTATAATELGGVGIAEGDAVVMFYESANRDESVFADPDRFDIRRDPNPHVAFGGGGPHFCLGANLARAELRAVFGRLGERVVAIRAGVPDHLTSNFVNGIKRMNVSVAPR
jgi:cytochrome P450